MIRHHSLVCRCGIADCIVFFTLPDWIGGGGEGGGRAGVGIGVARLKIANDRWVFPSS